MIETFEIVAKAFADPSRMRVLKLLQGGELCVCQLTTVLDLAPATVSKHLSVLKAAGLVQQRKAGRWVYYRLAGVRLNAYASDFLALAAKSLEDDPTVAEDRRLLTALNDVPLDILCAQGRAALGDADLSTSCCTRNA